jgi:hypothetical protein
MPRRNVTPSLARAASFGLALALLSPAASAQRRIIGAEPSTPEEPAEEAAPEDGEKKSKADEEKKKKAEEARKKAEAEAEEKRRAKEAAEEAAQKAADEAEQKKRAAEEKKKRDAIEREKARLEANRAGRLKAAKKARLYTREDGDVVVGVSLEPGKADPDKVMEVRFEVNERLEVAHPRYGNRMPLKDLVLTATVEEPAKGKGAGKSYRYVVQPLRAPGSYGMHHTPRLEGEHTIRIEGKSRDGKKSVSFSFPVHVGVWPPPDFDDEEAKNAGETAGRAGGGRRIVGN